MWAWIISFREQLRGELKRKARRLCSLWYPLSCNCDFFSGEKREFIAALRDFLRDPIRVKNQQFYSTFLYCNLTIMNVTFNLWAMTQKGHDGCLTGNDFSVKCLVHVFFAWEEKKNFLWRKVYVTWKSNSGHV
jgi:hypothetical protein